MFNLIGKPSIFMGHGLTMAMLVITRGCIYIYIEREIKSTYNIYQPIWPCPPGRKKMVLPALWRPCVWPIACAFQDSRQAHGTAIWG